MKILDVGRLCWRRKQTESARGDEHSKVGRRNITFRFSSRAPSGDEDNTEQQGLEQKPDHGALNVASPRQRQVRRRDVRRRRPWFPGTKGLRSHPFRGRYPATAHGHA